MRPHRSCGRISTRFALASGRPIYGWFFGHEHGCTIYDDSKLPYRARLIGHGCIPHTPPSFGFQPDAGCASVFKINTQSNSNGDAISGFALLNLNGDQIGIKYINEDGSVFYSETWQR